MPFTPFHLGPGAAFKTVGGKHFSFLVFGGAQVLMDIEPLVGIVRGWPILHGVTHNLLGALIIGLVAGAIGRPVGESVEGLHVLCLAAGLLGLAIIAGRALVSQFQRSATRSGRGRLRRGTPPG